MKIDPRLLRYLRTIDDTGTFIRAAQVEGISQPALTNKIGVLERQLGVRLIDRGRHGAKLNQFGKLLLRHARLIDNAVGQAAEEIALAKIGESGPLVVGGTPISMLEMIPKALNRMDQPEKRIQISLIEADDDALLDKLQAGEIDLMLGGMVSGRNEFNVVEEPLADFPLQAVVGRSNPFWNHKEIALEDVVDQPWALPASGSVIRSYVDAIFVAAGQKLPNSYWSCSSMHALKSVVQHTSRISLMPRQAFLLESEMGILKDLSLIGPTSSRKMNVLRLDHALLSPVAEEFIQLLREVSRDLMEKQ